MNEHEIKRLELFDEFLSTYNVVESSAELRIRLYLYKHLVNNYNYETKSIRRAVNSLEIDVAEDIYSDEFLDAFAERLATYLDMCCAQIGDGFGTNDNLNIVASTLGSVDL